jgi:6-phosphogluconolactonase
MSDRNIRVFATPQAVADEAAQYIAISAARCIKQNGVFTMALSGGSTPKLLYEALSADPYRAQIDWSKIEVYFSDERCVPPDHPDSNYRMASQALLSRVPIPAGQVHRMRGEIDPNEAAKEYGLMLKERFGDGGLDLTLLGMGDDGHTASLFPATSALKETDHRVVANFVPKFNAHRLTMTALFLNRSWDVLILVTGAAKTQRLSEILESDPSARDYPIQSIDPALGTLTWYLDSAAAGM